VIKPKWFRRESDGGYSCTLCPRACSFRPREDALGFCGVRGLCGGEPCIPGYGRCVSLSMDPIEKKPLYHFLPGSTILSTGPAGCNLSCDFCQNWTISQERNVPARYVSPEDLAQLAMSRGSCGVAFTYTEPTIWFEYIADTAPLVRDKGGATVMVSNGEINPRPLKELLEVTDAWNVDLKSWSEEFYREHCGGDRNTVLDTISTLAASRCHLEITFLIIPGENDDPEEWKEMAGWIADNCGPDTVLHISRYFPGYRLKNPPTPRKTMQHALRVFSKKLNFVYPGNIAGLPSHTVCPDCGAECISRNGYLSKSEGIDRGECSSCGRELGIVHEIPF